jgi:hypothetical protein
MRYAHRLWFIRALILANLGIIRLKVPVPGISSVPVPLQERTKRPMAGHELLPDADDETRYAAPRGRNGGIRQKLAAGIGSDLSAKSKKIIECFQQLGCSASPRKNL